MTKKPSKEKASDPRPGSGPGVFHLGDETDELTALLSELEDLDLEEIGGPDGDVLAVPEAEVGPELELAADDFEPFPPSPAAPAPAPAAPARPAAVAPTEGPRLLELQRELDDVKTRAQKAAADFANYRKRLQKEKDEAVQYGNERILKDLLPVLDNLQLALAHADESGFEQLVSGVRMTQSLMLSTLGRHGLRAFESSGQPFDPRRHQAMARVESDAVDPGTVVAEGQRGYLLNERLLRAALVSVAVAPAGEPTPAMPAPAAVPPKPLVDDLPEFSDERPPAEPPAPTKGQTEPGDEDDWELSEDIGELFDEIARSIK